MFVAPSRRMLKLGTHASRAIAPRCFAPPLLTRYRCLASPVPSGSGESDHRVLAYWDDKFLREELTRAGCPADAKRDIEAILQVYADIERSAAQRVESTACADGVRSTFSPATIGDMAHFEADADHTEFTRRVAAAVLNLDEYPLDRLHEPCGEELVQRVRAQLTESSTCFLPNFVKPFAVQVCANLFDYLNTTRRATHYSKSSHNIYFSPSDHVKYNNDHPVNITGDRTQGFIAGDYLCDEKTVLKHVFRYPPFKELIRRALNKGDTPIYCTQDPVNQVVCNVQEPTEQFPWHFDGNEYIITLTLRSADQGGELWTAPDLRDPKDENLDSVRQLLMDSRQLEEGKDLAEVDGSQLEYQKAGATETSSVRTYRADPGDLQFFLGRYCLHKIAAVGKESCSRLVAIFAFTDEQNFVNPVSRSILNCGRAYPQHYERERRLKRDHL